MHLAHIDRVSPLSDIVEQSFAKRSIYVTTMSGFLDSYYLPERLIPVDGIAVNADRLAYSPKLFLRLTRKSHPTIPIVVRTDRAEKTHRDELKDAGATRIVSTEDPIFAIKMLEDEVIAELEDEAPAICFGKLVFDLETRDFLIGGEAATSVFSKTDLALIRGLVHSPNGADRKRLSMMVYGKGGVPVDLDTINKIIWAVRKKAKDADLGFTIESGAGGFVIAETDA